MPEVKIPVVMISTTDGAKLIEKVNDAARVSQQHKKNEDQEDNASIRGGVEGGSSSVSTEKKQTETRIGNGCLFTIGVHLSCPICREDFELENEEKNKAASLPCGHLFHSSCIKPWLKKQRFCPMCRSELPQDDSKSSGASVRTQYLEEMRNAMYQ